MNSLFFVNGCKKAHHVLDPHRRYMRSISNLIGLCPCQIPTLADSMPYSCVRSPWRLMPFAAKVILKFVLFYIVYRAVMNYMKTFTAAFSIIKVTEVNFAAHQLSQLLRGSTNPTTLEVVQ